MEVRRIRRNRRRRTNRDSGGVIVMDGRIRNMSCLHTFGILLLGVTLVIVGIVCLLISYTDILTNSSYADKITVLSKSVFLKDDVCSTNDCKKTEGNVCKTEICKESAIELFRSMNQTVDPCNNFYMYACANYLHGNKVPKGLIELNNFDIMHFSIKAQLNESLSSIEKSKSKSYKLARTYYKSCMKADKNAVDEIKRVVEKMKSVGGWPMVEGDNWNENDFDVWDVINKLHQFGYVTNPLINFEVTKAVNMPNHSLVISPAQQLLSIAEFIKSNKTTDYLRGYLHFIIVLADELGANEKNIGDDALKIIDFEQQLIKIKTFCKQDGEMHQMGLGTFRKEFPGIPLLEIIKNLLPESVTIEDDEFVMVTCPEYYKNLESLLKSTPRRVIANYIMWRNAYDSTEMLNKKIRDFRKMLTTVRRKRIVNHARWLECVTMTNELDKALGSVYVQEHFDPHSLNRVMDMAKRLKEKLIDNLQQNDWMDPSSKQNILTKVESMSIRIGFPKELVDDEKLDKYYDGLDLSEDSFVENTLKVMKFNADKKYGKLREPFNKDDWIDFNVLDVRISYYPQISALQVLNGFIQHVFFQVDRPKYMNYGALGTLIAREMYEIFKPSAIFLEKSRNTVQFSNSTMALYNKRIQCMVNRYTNYAKKLTGVELLKKDQTFVWDQIFTNVKGTKLAYAAYDQWVKENGEEAELPELKRSPRQLFWLSLANSFCTKHEDLPKTGPHHFYDLLKPTELWLNSGLSVISEFAADYNCPIGSEMNPVHECDFS